MPRTRSSDSSGAGVERPSAGSRPRHSAPGEAAETALLVVGALLSLSWLILCGWLVRSHAPGLGGESSLLDFAILAAGASAPLALLWSLLLFGLGGLRSRAQTRAAAFETALPPETSGSELPDRRSLQEIRREMGRLVKETRELAERLAEIRANVRRLDEGIGADSERLVQASALAVGRSEELRAAIAAAVAEQAAGAAAAEEAAQRLEARLSGSTARLATLAASLDAALGGLPGALEAQAEGLEQSLARAEGLVESLGATLSARAAEMVRIASELGQQAESLRGTLAEQPAGLLVTAEGALATARQVSKAFDDEGRRLREVAALCKRHAQELQLAADEAGKAQLRLQMSDLESRRDLFLRTASQLLQDLNSSAFELERHLEGEIPEELWRKWQSGDRRHLLVRLLGRAGKPRGPEPLVSRYREDEAFRAQVDRYLERFEGLMNQAAGCDPENVLTAAFMTADVGKLYLLLARVAGRRR